MRRMHGRKISKEWRSVEITHQGVQTLVPPSEKLPAGHAVCAAVVGHSKPGLHVMQSLIASPVFDLNDPGALHEWKPDVI